MIVGFSAFCKQTLQVFPYLPCYLIKISEQMLFCFLQVALAMNCVVDEDETLVYSAARTHANMRGLGIWKQMRTGEQHPISCKCECGK